MSTSNPRSVPLDLTSDTLLSALLVNYRGRNAADLKKNHAWSLERALQIPQSSNDTGEATSQTIPSGTRIHNSNPTPGTKNPLQEAVPAYKTPGRSAASNGVLVKYVPVESILHFEAGVVIAIDSPLVQIKRSCLTRNILEATPSLS